MNERLEKQLRFIVEIDKMKSVYRRTYLVDRSRRENDAEHSWHLAMMAMLLGEYAPEGTDVNRAVRMCLAHDLIEIYSGDTFAYDAAGNGTKEVRERDAAGRLYAILPGEQGAELRALWEEFDLAQTPDARFATALDRLQPMMHNYLTAGATWKEGNVHAPAVYARMEPIRTALPEIWPVVEYMITDAVKKGDLQP